MAPTVDRRPRAEERLARDAVAQVEGTSLDEDDRGVVRATGPVTVANLADRPRPNH